MSFDEHGVCVACQLANMLATGVITSSVDAGHSQCEGTTEVKCACSCDYAQHRACRDCARKMPDEKLGPTSQCIDRRDCANAILAVVARKTAEREARRAAAPSKPTRATNTATSAGKRPDCLCECGEQTGGGYYRPGHDARHVSKLAAAVKSKELTLDAALTKIRHSDKLVAKLEKAVGV